MKIPFFQIHCYNSEIFYVYNIRFRQAMAPSIRHELYSINSFSRTSEMMQGGGIVEPTPVPPKKPAPLN